MNKQIAAIVARLNALGNVTWKREYRPSDHYDAIFAESPSGKQWQVARTSDGLNKRGVVPDFIANAPSDIRALLAERDMVHFALGGLFDESHNELPERVSDLRVAFQLQEQRIQTLEMALTLIGAQNYDAPMERVHDIVEAGMSDDRAQLEALQNQ